MIAKDPQKGATHFAAFHDMILNNIEQTFTREPEGGVDASGVLHKKQITPFLESDNKTMHDTEGWKSLETSMRILQNIIEAIGTKLYDFNLERILGCILKGVDHINRFVREISYFVLHAIFMTSEHILKEEAASQNVLRFHSFCDKLVPIIAQGLSDNWSQVRYAASQAVRSYYAIAKEN